MFHVYSAPPAVPSHTAQWLNETYGANLDIAKPRAIIPAEAVGGGQSYGVIMEARRRLCAQSCKANDWVKLYNPISLSKNGVARYSLVFSHCYI